MVYISSSCIKSTSVIESVKALGSITKNIELSGGSSYNSNLLGELVRLKTDEDYSLLVHSYFPPPQKHFLLNFADTSDRTRGFISKSMEIVTALGVPYYSIHAGFTKDYSMSEQEKLEAGSREFNYDGVGQNISWFFDNYKDCGLALENLFPNFGNKECCFWMQPACIRKGLHDNPRVKLLFDFGHLNVTAQTFGLKWSYECESLLDEFIPRIAEIHLSENSGSGDEHLPITSNSLQLAMIKKYRKQLKEHNVKLTIEARSATFDELAVSYDLVKNKLEE